MLAPAATSPEPSLDDLRTASRQAWRRAARCVGRAGWAALTVRDARHLTDPGAVASDLVAHLRQATNGGAIRSTLTVLNPRVRVVSDQLVRYLDDPQYAGFARSVAAMGWPVAGRRFEVAPLALAVDGEVSLHAVPADAVLEVPIAHPHLPWFADLGLRWHATPAIATMMLHVPPEHCYPVVFNGWYVSDEISARNLAGPDRYDVLPAVAAGLGLDVADDEDGYALQRALLEVDAAVLWSFRRAGVKISSPRREAERFAVHCTREEAAGQPVPTDWSWVISPITPVLWPTYHRYYDAPAPGGPDLLSHPPLSRIARHGWHDEDGQVLSDLLTLATRTLPAPAPPTDGT